MSCLSSEADDSMGQSTKVIGISDVKREHALHNTDQVQVNHLPH